MIETTTTIKMERAITDVGLSLSIHPLIEALSMPDEDDNVVAAATDVAIYGFLNAGTEMNR